MYLVSTFLKYFVKPEWIESCIIVLDWLNDRLSSENELVLFSQISVVFPTVSSVSDPNIVFRTWIVVFKLQILFCSFEYKLKE